MQKAKKVLGSVIKPEKKKQLNYYHFIEQGGRGDLDIVSSIEESISGNNTLSVDSLRFEARVEKEQPVAVVMDTSLSMTGEKIALLAVSCAVLALCVKPQQISLMGFDSKVKWIKRFGEEMSVEKIIERILELPAGGFTNMELAFKESLKMLDKIHKSHSNVILISDGKYTEGADPYPLAKYFKKLNVLKIGKDQAGRDLLLELTTAGNGKFFEVKNMHDLPKTMYNAMKTLLR